MGNKFCNNCQNICSGNNNIYEENLSNNNQISNDVVQDDIILSILSTHKFTSENVEYDKRLKEIIVLNNVRKIIKIYKNYLDKKKLKGKQNNNVEKNSNNSKTFKNLKRNSLMKRNFDRKLLEINTEINSRSSRDKTSILSNSKNYEDLKKNIQDTESFNSNDKEFINYKFNKKKTEFLNSNNQKVQFRNGSNEKEGSTLSASISKDEVNLSKNGKKNVSFMNHVETKIIEIKDNEQNSNNIFFNNDSQLYKNNHKNSKYKKNSRIERGRNIINNLGLTDETKESTIKNNNNIKFQK